MVLIVARVTGCYHGCYGNHGCQHGCYGNHGCQHGCYGYWLLSWLLWLLVVIMVAGCYHGRYGNWLYYSCYGY